ncbi:predicted protein [Naegleria gruberi]|uniref:Predicted protein n=1 Tax=Naegleria gruberi TaxID=5762 RepID=D2VIK6_NAEGR|nr:uncharacterized protein NAEGRDRAFT_34446 [Naegleria gruberi]EFC43287.1 predicted protein [Naegleria gruberi]|eukprot:XP_002676031.1 predicted protein [Naegleria gruberi strain NEG-M]
MLSFRASQLRPQTLCIVTGASKGIGREITKQLSEWGVHCATISRSEIEAKDLFPNQYHFPCDVSNAKQVSETIKQISQQFGKSHAMNMLVNAAGISKDGLLLRFSQEDVEEIMNINLMGTINVCKSSLRYFMLSHSSGEMPSSIVNISSVIGGTHMTNVGQSVYAASKAGVVAFSQNLSRELLGRDVRVNVVSPGFIETEMTKHISDSISKTSSEQKNEMVQKIEKVRMGKPKDVASMVRFLLSEQSEYINGQNLVVDGGLSLL